MKPDLVTDAMALAFNLATNERLNAADAPVTAAWLAEGLDRVADERPSGADGEGSVTVGELRDARDEPIGFVRVQPGTKARRIVGSEDRS
jgi:hypothetical protein